MARLRVPRPIGRPKTTSDMILADNAYSSRPIRSRLRRRGIRAVIPQPADRAANRKRLGSCGGRPPVFGRDAYEQRNTVETATIDLAGLHLAAIFIRSAR